MASKSFGGTVKLQGESEYQKALRGITDNLKVLNSEMKVVTSTYDKNNASSADLLTTNQSLNKKLEEQKGTVEVLKKALADAEKETGENSDTTKKWQVELNKAQAEVNETTKKIDENTDVLKRMEKANVDTTKELKEFEEQERKAGDGALKLGDIIKGNLISDAIKAGIKGLASAIKGVGSAFVNLGKQAIQSYAQYEQLVGGVDTLFGESSKKVQEYASNAYKTAGLSANQYMETVTSFSASLLQSLDGDTAKSADIANMAITDMSDNANKMGTSMESIQNAYQGFAKGNYTMLDNLKLGYGGTAREMARLVNESGVLGDAIIDLDDKQNLSANLQEVGYAKIIEAIHAVQGEMGIAGTTSIEASKTISGSTGSMKSAWENLVTGIADDNANFEQLVDNLVISIVGEGGEGGVLNNILPRIETALDGIVQMVVSLTQNLLPQVMQIAVDLIMTLATGISENLPALLESASTILDTVISGLASALPALLESANAILNTLISGIATALPQLIPMVVQIISLLCTTILEQLPLILEMGIQMLVSLVQGIASMLPELIPLAIEAVLNLVDTLLENIDLIIDAGIELIIGLADGLIVSVPLLLEKIPIIISKLIGAFVGNLPKLTAMGIELLIKLGAGLIMAIPDLLLEVPMIITAIVGGLVQGVGKIADVGLDLVKGLWQGIKDAGGWIMDKIKGFGASILNSIKGIFGIHSPSTVFRDEVGKNLALGLGEGFSDTMADVSAEMQGAIPTEFDADVSANLNAGSSHSSTYDMMVSAFKQALTEVKVVMNNREMGAFVKNTVERAVYT